jgi:succinyl-CoA synthetase alpha subunit
MAQNLLLDLLLVKLLLQEEEWDMLVQLLVAQDDTAAAKMKIMRECGIHVVESPAVIGKTMAKVLGKVTA